MKLDTLSVATPPVSVPLPIVLPPSLNVMVPEGALPVTVAVRSVAAPKALGFALEVNTVPETTALTVCVKVADVLGALLTSPLYKAVKLWLPAERLERVRLAAPLDTVAVPMVLVPSLKVTVPVGVGPAMVAVNVIEAPKVLGFVLDANVVAETVLLTVWTTGDDVLVPLLPSPPYTAVMLWTATLKLETVSVATNDPFNVALPIEVAPSIKVTVPVGAIPVTVALNVAGELNAVGVESVTKAVLVGATLTV